MTSLGSALSHKLGWPENEMEIKLARCANSPLSVTASRWQLPVADVGPTGDDEGKGAKYLFLPPGYNDLVSDGYRVYRPATFSPPQLDGKAANQEVSGDDRY